MSNLKNENKYIEDEFDLDEFKKEASMLKRYENFKNKNEKLVRFLSFIIMILAFIIAYLAYQILNYYIGMLRNEYIRGKTREATKAQTAPRTPGTAPSEPVAEDSAVRSILPEVAELRRTFSNDDIVGFLQIDGTSIDYAVAQAADNEFYLYHDLYGKENKGGSIFMDFENNIEELDKNTVIYGHNMDNGSMFHNLRYYIDKEFYDVHPYIYLKTPYEETVWEVFAFYHTDADFYYIQTGFVNQNDFVELLTRMKEKSMHGIGVPVDADDNILTLSTCTNAADDSRYVLHAKLYQQTEAYANG